MTGSGDGRVVAPDRAASGALLQDAGLPQDAAALALVGEYLQRTKRARRLGLVAGLIVFLIVGSQGTTHLPWVLLWCWLVTCWAYCSASSVPLAVAAARSGWRLCSRGRRRRCCRPGPIGRRGRPSCRRPVHPLLLLGSHPQGVTSYHDPSASCSALAEWPSAQVLWAVACAALVGLGVCQLTVRRLVRMRYPAEDEDLARVDLLLRGVSARAVVGGATSLGLALISGTGYLIGVGLHSWVCPPSGRLAPVYPFAPGLDVWLQPAELLVLMVSLLIWAVSRRRVDHRLRRGASRWL
jgi:hypothetical protein